jgi:hypothetical protein
MEITIRLESFNKTFYAGSNITGTIQINNGERAVDFSHLNLTLNV